MGNNTTDGLNCEGLPDGNAYRITLDDNAGFTEDVCHTTIQYLKELGLIQVSGTDENGDDIYSLTEDGDLVNERLLRILDDYGIKF